MNLKTRLPDVLLNIVLPLVLGTTIYFLPPTPFIRNYIPDGFWAYAFTSCILIIWDRKIHPIWLMATILCFICFEALQSYNLFPGTADIIDVFIYLLFFAIALLTNKIFFNSQTINQPT